MNQTPEELAEQLAKRLAIEHLPHPFELSALPLILSAIQSATQPLVRRVKELETALQHSAGITERLTAENAELRKDKERLDWLTSKDSALIENRNGRARCWWRPLHISEGPTLRATIDFAIDQARNQ
jgi:hypothetical protein